MYLLDTNVISELRKAKSGKANNNVVAWANSVSTTQLYLSVVTILEVETGILLVNRRDPVQGELLQAWFDSRVLPAFSDRIIAVDTTIARCCAKLHVPDPQSDRDALIAATAIVHDMIVVTRNVNDFISSGVSIINPWEFDNSTN